MKRISEKRALEQLAVMKREFQSVIRENYEFRALDCETCPTQGACCLDAHFVNVHVSRLEAVAMRQKIDELPSELRGSVDSRIDETIAKFKLGEAIDTFAVTYACPLFEKGIGCLVHDVKPAACMSHACYERQEDLPPDRLLDEVETEIDGLNKQTYRNSRIWLPIPLMLRRA